RVIGSYTAWPATPKAPPMPPVKPTAALCQDSLEAIVFVPSERTATSTAFVTAVRVAPCKVLCMAPGSLENSDSIGLPTAWASRAVNPGFSRRFFGSINSFNTGSGKVLTTASMLCQRVNGEGLGRGKDLLQADSGKVRSRGNPSDPVFHLFIRRRQHDRRGAAHAYCPAR